MAIRITNGALHESPLRGGTIILRGVIHPDCLCLLKADTYQREVMVGSNQNKLMTAFKQGESIPDVDLGMRGQEFYQPKKDGVILEGEFILKNDIYIIDGLQRVSAAIQSRTVSEIHLGATIHFDTTKEWEQERFYILNTRRLRVHPNIHLRNLREKHPGILALYGLSYNDQKFVAYQRIAWGQKMKRDELVSAFSFAKVAGSIHAWRGRGLLDHSIPNLVNGLDSLINDIGIMTYKRNLSIFYSTIDECWGLSAIQFRESAPQLKNNFQTVLAAVFSDHKDFWSGKHATELLINSDTRKKLAKLRMNDPTVQNLSGSAGKSRHLLYDMLREHVNSGRRTNRLVPRDPAGVPSFVDEEEEAA